VIGDVLAADSNERDPLIHYDRAYWPFTRKG
jgi:hypothetical protein